MNAAPREGSPTASRKGAGDDRHVWASVPATEGWGSPSARVALLRALATERLCMQHRRDKDVLVCVARATSPGGRGCGLVRVRAGGGRGAFSDLQTLLEAPVV